MTETDNISNLQKNVIDNSNPETISWNFLDQICFGPLIVFCPIFRRFVNDIKLLFGEFDFGKVVTNQVTNQVTSGIFV